MGGLSVHECHMLVFETLDLYKYEGTSRSMLETKHLMTVKLNIKESGTCASHKLSASHGGKVECQRVDLMAN